MTSKAARTLAAGEAKNFSDAMALFRRQIEDEIVFLKAAGTFTGEIRAFWEAYISISRRAETIHDAAMRATVQVLVRTLERQGQTESHIHNRATNGRPLYDPEILYRDIAKALESGDYTGLALPDGEDR